MNDDPSNNKNELAPEERSAILRLRRSLINSPKAEHFFDPVKLNADFEPITVSMVELGGDKIPVDSELYGMGVEVIVFENEPEHEEAEVSGSLEPLPEITSVWVTYHEKDAKTFYIYPYEDRPADIKIVQPNMPQEKPVTHDEAVELNQLLQGVSELLERDNS
jgi:hypothetical protein